jgi:transposase
LKRFARTSLIAGLKNNQPVAPMVFRGYCETEMVLDWVKEMVIPALEPGDEVIGDQARFHKSARTQEALSEASGTRGLFLSPYNPDLNPIEQFWSWLKAWTRGLNEPLLHSSIAINKVFQTLNAEL